MSNLTFSRQTESVHKKIKSSAYCFSFIHTEQWLLIFHVLINILEWQACAQFKNKQKKAGGKKTLFKITSEKFQVAYLFHLSFSIIKML